jgi:Xaa-Pro aminopeptidase
MRKAAGKADAVLISRPEDVSHLSGFTGGDSLLLLGPGCVLLITDGRYAEQARAECGGIELVVRSGPMPDPVVKALKGRRIRRLGVQGDHVTVAFRQSLEQKLPTRRVRALANLTGSLRAVKDDGEVRAIRRAIRVAQRAFRELLGLGRRWWIGRRERDLAAELDYRMRLAGADGPSFPTIVAAGAHGSLPHYRPGSTRIGAGDAVLIDWGANVGGYCSDLTRVVFTGTIPPRLAGIHEVVRCAQAAGIAALRAGASCRAVDAAARKVIVEAGYGEQFVHSLGHGLGRQVHEAPGLGRTAKGRLRAGMVVTVEPGIYLPGFGGVRIEDDVLVTRDGARRLSSLPRGIAAMTL